MSRQDKWKVAQFKAKRCVNCGKPREPKEVSGYLRLCVSCGKYQKVQRREKQKESNWKPGNPGRIPIWALNRKAKP